jgi:glycosyltransferase involved in cell wall biosynthesis
VPVTPFVSRSRLDLLAVLRLRRVIRECDPDLVYAPRNSTLANALLASRGHRARIIGYRGTIGHVQRWDPAAWLTYLNPRLSRIVCVSEAVREHLISCGVAADRCWTVHKGHDVTWYDNLPRPDLTSLDLPMSAILVTFVGNMRAVKGVDILIRASDKIADEPRVHLLLVGEVRDPALKELASKSRMADRIHFTGFRADAAAITGNSHIFVMPSVDREGLPRAVVEAMAQRVATVVTRVGGLPELVIDGRTGLVVPPKDPDALADAILSLVRDPQRRTTLGRQARAHVAAKFQIRATVEKMTRLFEDVAKV